MPMHDRTRFLVDQYAIDCASIGYTVREFVPEKGDGIFYRIWKDNIDLAFVALMGDNVIFASATFQEIGDADILFRGRYYQGQLIETAKARQIIHER